MFKKQFDSVPHQQPHGGLLLEAMGIIGKLSILPLGDSAGRFGCLYNDCVLVAKQYIFGDVVSCHLQAVYSAKNNSVPLVMFIGNTKKFYSFNPDEILSSGEENMKGDAKMINFSIRLGKRWEVS